MAKERYVGETFTNGTDGDDFLYGGNAKDEIHGLKGNDVIFGGWLSDLLKGGAGDDQIMAGDGNDFVYGDNGKDKLYGDAGDDLIHGGNGRDELWGSDGADCLYGDRGNDVLNGEDGNDLLDGGRGNDVLTGGRGADKFVLGHSSGHDTITDFSGPAKGSEETQTITFDDLQFPIPDVVDVPIPNGYAGLNWSDWFRAVSDGSFESSGYNNGVTSGHWVAYNATASFEVQTPVFVYDDEDFSVLSGQFTAAWNDGLTVTATAYDDGAVTGTQTFTVDTSGPSLITFGADFESIDRMELIASGGTQNPDFIGGGEFFALDDLAISRDTSDSEGDLIVLDGGCAADVERVIEAAKENRDGDAVIHYDGASMTLEGVSKADLTADYFFYS